jgi:SNF2 family DNA or RNA helicase
MIILHAASDGTRLWVWGEGAAPAVPRRRGRPAAVARHPFAIEADSLGGALQTLGILTDGAQSLVLWLPTATGRPLPSTALLGDAPAGAVALAPWRVTAVPLAGDDGLHLWSACAADALLAPGLFAGDDLRVWAFTGQFAAGLVARQRYVPGLVEEAGRYRACWDPILDGEDARRLSALAAAMPEAGRAIGTGDNPPETPARTLLEAWCAVMVDALARPGAPPIRPTRTLPAPNLHAQWMAALRAPAGWLTGDPTELATLAGEVRRWRDPLRLSLAAPYRLVFRLEEPERAEGDWQVRYLLQPVDDPSLLLPAAQILTARGKKAAMLQRGTTAPRDFLLAALGAASPLSPRIEESLHAKAPDGFTLDAAGAHAFLSETAPLLDGLGYGVLLPAWWTRRGAKLRLAARATTQTPKKSVKTKAGLSLDEIVQFAWTVAVGDEELSLPDLQALAALKAPLVQLRGQWVELNPDDLRHALNLLDNPTGAMSGRELARMALGGGTAPGGLAVEGVQADGALGELLAQLQGQTPFAEVPPPTNFTGTLRPYQQRGYSWLAFLQRWGLGACLADDMGLGKTVQALALLQRAREAGETRPTLLICPTSVVNNWRKEAERFTPELPVLIHHGGDRRKGGAFVAEATRHALVLSSYALLHRDLATLADVAWAGVILDEAQFVKNPETKAAKAVRALPTDARIALTGTPVENHVGDLWALMDYLNPGLLGTRASFRTQFLTPIQADRDPDAAARLKRLTGPFVLRRVKTDRSIIADLPDKQEMTVYCPLTREQASLYLAVTQAAEAALESADGIGRKGLVLATLSKLKQVCNHPAHFLADGSAIPGRSGKLERLTEMLAELLAVGDRALIFTQFTEMGALLQQHLQESFGQEVLFLHGGVPKEKRDRMVERFSTDAHAPAIFLLSLKAGGTGLNLTRANHVFHFDRWWNPAVENQATDRAFRIGQTKGVQVHKFVCAGTLEEKIHDLIERKRTLAESVIGTGEGWLTELSTADLRALFALGADAVVE